MVSTAEFQDLHGLLWVVITSAGNRGWPDDVPAAIQKLAGLSVPSVVRSAEIATIDAAAASKLRQGSADQVGRITGRFRQRLGTV